MCGRSTTHAPASPLFKDLGKQTLHALRLHPTTVSGDSFLQTLPEFVSQAIFVRYNNGTRTCLYFTFCKSSLPAGRCLTFFSLISEILITLLGRNNRLQQLFGPWLLSTAYQHPLVPLINIGAAFLPLLLSIRCCVFLAPR